MIRVIINCLLILVINMYIPNQVNAENKLDFYMNDFYTKSNEASLILKEIERDMKQGIKKNFCSRQIKAAKLGILANESLIKAYEIAGTNPPTSSLYSIKNRC